MSRERRSVTSPLPDWLAPSVPDLSVKGQRTLVAVGRGRGLGPGRRNTCRGCPSRRLRAAGCRSVDREPAHASQPAYARSNKAEIYRIEAARAYADACEPLSRHRRNPRRPQLEDRRKEPNKEPDNPRLALPAEAALRPPARRPPNGSITDACTAPSPRGELA